MKITVFGATGGTGRQVLRQAVAAGHEVTAVVRDRTRLDDASGLTVVEADVTNPIEIGPAVAGRDAIVSALGPRDSRSPSTICADGVASIAEAMGVAGVRRLVAVSASGLATDEGDGPFTRRVVKPILGAVLRHPFADMRRMEDLVRATDLEWTIVRPPQLTDGPRTGKYRAEIGRNVRGGLRVSRADLADHILGCLADHGPLHATVAIGY